MEDSAGAIAVWQAIEDLMMQKPKRGHGSHAHGHDDCREAEGNPEEDALKTV
ncbi:MAG TPA: hypothetical protein VFA67_19105 [Candidatus Sulfotelmatobacter sp.]|nr:hypothetical protein [Candidatus Sulfotelmatobacter sp.]